MSACKSDGIKLCGGCREVQFLHLPLERLLICSDYGWCRSRFHKPAGQIRFLKSLFDEGLTVTGTRDSCKVSAASSTLASSIG
jgi:hypothetical protein